MPDQKGLLVLPVVASRSPWMEELGLFLRGMTIARYYVGGTAKDRRRGVMELLRYKLGWRDGD